MQKNDFQYVSYLWDDTVASKLDPVNRLVYRSNMLGADQRITNTGGGNTSSKITEKDPLTGQSVSAAAKASDNASSAAATSCRRAARNATSFP